jgi:formyl-CoA transferase
MRASLVRTLATGTVDRRPGTKGWKGLAQIFKSHPGGYNDYVMVRLAGDIWEMVLAVIGREDLIGDERYATNEARAARADEVEAIVSEWTSKRTKYEAFEVLASAGVWCGAVLGQDEIIANEHLVARGMIVKVEDGQGGAYKTIGNPVKMEKTPGTVTGAPHYSQHTVEILTTLLNVSPVELSELQREGVIV